MVETGNRDGRQLGTTDLHPATRGKGASKDQLTVSVEGPPCVAAELVEQKSSGTWLLHLINFDSSRTISNVLVSLRLPKGRRLKETVAESPDSLASQVLSATDADGVVSFRVPHLKVYNLVRLTFAAP